MRFGELLKEIRVKNGDSIRGLANKGNINFSFIDKVEKGIALPSENLLEVSIKVYPLYKKQLINKYMKERLPKVVLNEITIDEEIKFLDNVLILLQMLDIEDQKILLKNIVEKVELSAYQNGTLLEMKDLLEEIKEKIEEL